MLAAHHTLPADSKNAVCEKLFCTLLAALPGSWQLASNGADAAPGSHRNSKRPCGLIRLIPSSANRRMMRATMASSAAMAAFSSAILRVRAASAARWAILPWFLPGLTPADDERHDQETQPHQETCSRGSLLYVCCMDSIELI